MQIWIATWSARSASSWTWTWTSRPGPGVAIDEQVAAPDCAVAKQHRSIVQHDEVHLVGAQSRASVRDQGEPQVETPLRVEPRLRSHRDVHVGQGATTGRFGTFGGVALFAFVVSTLAAIYVLLPRTSLVFSLSAPVLYESLLGKDEPDAHRALAYWLEDYWRANRREIRRLVVVFFVSGGALVAEVVCWALALRGTLS